MTRTRPAGTPARRTRSALASEEQTTQPVRPQPLVEGAPPAPLAEEHEGRPVPRRQGRRQAEQLPLGAAEERRGRQVDEGRHRLSAVRRLRPWRAPTPPG